MLNSITTTRIVHIQMYVHVQVTALHVLPALCFLQGSRDKASTAGIRRPYLRVVGIQVDSDGPGRASGAPLAPEEEEELRQLASRPDIHDIIARSIAPSIYGSIGEYTQFCLCNVYLLLVSVLLMR